MASLLEKSAKACESCRRRKIRCSKTSPACTSCVASNVACTYKRLEKPRRRPQPSSRRIDHLKARIEWVEKHLNHRSLSEVETRPSVFIKDHDTVNDDLSCLSGGKTSFSEAHEVFPLPPIDERLALLEYYFNNFNQVIPLFDKTTFLIMVRAQNGQERDDPARWAAVNVGLALAHRLKAIGIGSAEEENQMACRFLHNALRVVPELELSKPSLLGVQALLGAAIILQGTHNPRPASALVAATIRMCHSLGLHRQNHAKDQEFGDAEQEKRVFWIAYLLDKDYSLRLDQPPTQRDDEMDVPMPTRAPRDGGGNIYAVGGTEKINFFSLLIELSVILGKTYSMLYSVKAQKQSELERSRAVQTLDDMLNDWTGSIPEPFRPENMTRALPPPAIVHMVILYLSYFNCLVKVHSDGLHDDALMLKRVVDNDSSKPEFFSGSQEKCLRAARAALRLLELIPQGDNACTWLLIYYHFSAVIILLVNIKHNPQHALARCDLQLVKSSLNVLSLLRPKWGSDEKEDLYGYIVKLESAARNLVDGGNAKELDIQVLLERSTNRVFV